MGIELKKRREGSWVSHKWRAGMVPIVAQKASHRVQALADALALH